MQSSRRSAIAGRQFATVVVLAALTLIGARRAHAVELIPSLGVTKSADETADDAIAMGGLALRFPLLPFLKAEGAIGYRQDSYAEGSLKVRQWPLTTSLWLSPLPSLYAGGGLGWYRTTFDYSDNTLVADDTSMQMGVHLGGGVGLPLSPALGLDLNGRYIFMQADNDNVQVPTTFNPDFWSLSLGLVFKL
jgi:hypothetical protein